jgi:glucosamine-6-phosphate deaminase
MNKDAVDGRHFSVTIFGLSPTGIIAGTRPPSAAASIMRVFIRDDYRAMSATTASFVASSVEAFNSKKAGRKMNVALAAGFSTQAVFEVLSSLKLDFSNVNFFHVDEFVGLEREDPRCQANAMKRHLYDLEGIDVPEDNIHSLNAWVPASELGAECERYEELIASRGGLDLAIFGTGADGHVARNEPSSSLQSRTRQMSLAHDTRLQLAARWGVQLDCVPRWAVTMGVRTLFDSANAIVLFTGMNRSNALSSCLEQSINHMFPVSVFQRHTSCTFVCDEEATYELRVKTVAYFKGIEKTATENFGNPVHGGMKF